MIRDLMAGRDPKKESRRRFAMQYVRPHGLSTAAGEVAAHALEMAALGRNAKEINADIAASDAAKPGVRRDT